MIKTKLFFKKKKYYFTCSRRCISSSLTFSKSNLSEAWIFFCSSSYLRFMSISCSIFQFSTHFILSSSALVISLDGAALPDFEKELGRGGGSVIGMGGGRRGDKCMPLSSTSSSRSLSWSVSSLLGLFESSGSGLVHSLLVVFLSSFDLAAKSVVGGV